MREHIENSTGEIHHAKAVLKAFMRRRWIDKPSEGELVDVTKTLKCSRVNDSSFVGGKDDEAMDRIPKFVVFLPHVGMVAVAVACRSKFYPV